MGVLDEVHKLFLQSMISRKMILKAQASELFKDCAKLVGFALEMTPKELTEVLNTINSNITKFGLELKDIRSESSMDEYVVLVNVIDNSNSSEKLNHLYNVKEREFFRRVLEMIVTNEDAYGTVRTMDCINMADATLSASKIEELMKRFGADLWFTTSDEGLICPSPRCIAEFEIYFKNNYRDHVSICPLCNNVVFYGTQCLACDAITHKYCVVKYNKNRDTPKCSCNNEYPVGTLTREDMDMFSPQPTKKSKVQSEPKPRQSDLVDPDTPGPSRRNPKRHRE